MSRITVVNESPEFLELVRDILETDRHETVLIDGERADAAEAVVTSRPDLLLIDIRLGADELHGWEVAKTVRSDASLGPVPVLLCSGDLEALGALETELRGTRNVGTLTKPFAVEDLISAVDGLVGTVGMR